MTDDTYASGSVTYSPQDDKLRVYFVSRQPAEMIATLKEAGFRWAALQECWHAHWSPHREDAALAATGADAIDDESSSLEDRAAARAERFGGYSEKRERDGDRAHAAVAAIADNIPLGQPILVGHHSERRARKDAERIDNGMRKAVKMWETAQYWQHRARGVLASANYKNEPGARARRIKTLGAELRKFERSNEQCRACLAEFDHGQPFERLLELANSMQSGVPYETWSALSKCREMDPLTSAAEVRKIINDVRASRTRVVAWNDRWIAHLQGRLAFERELLGEQGASHLIEKRKRPAAPPLLNYRAPEGIEVRNPYRGGAECMGQVEMTKAEYAAIWKDYKGTRLSADGSHRVRSAMVTEGAGRRALALVFLTDSLAHPRPEGKS